VRPSVPRAEWLDNLFRYIQIEHWEQTALRAQVYGDIGVVTSRYAWNGTFHNAPFASAGYLVDVWVRRHNRWQVVSRTSGAVSDGRTLADPTAESPERSH
jgi:hypothetical protein